MSTPKTFMALAAEWRKTTYEYEGVTLRYDEDTIAAREACAEQLEALIREHSEALEDQDYDWSIFGIRRDILGLPEKP